MRIEDSKVHFSDSFAALCAPVDRSQQHGEEVHWELADREPQEEAGRRLVAQHALQDLEVDLTDRDVILVEDIVDTGLTLRYLRRSLEARGPSSLEVCALLARESADLEGLGVRYVGFTIPDDFVIGYGLEVAERYRNLRYLAIYDPDAS